jgi:hypothetical protein
MQGVAGCGGTRLGEGMEEGERDDNSDAHLLGDLFDGIEFTPDDERSWSTIPADAVASGAPVDFPRFRARAPLVLRGLAAQWQALERWSSESVLGSLTTCKTREGEASEISTDRSTKDGVMVLRSCSGRRFLKRDCAEERWPLADVAHYLLSAPLLGVGESRAHRPAIYARAPLTTRALADCDLSALEGMIGMPAKLANCGIWIGSASNITPFHYDLCHGFLVQVLGTKTFTFVPPSHWKSMYPRDGAPELSSIDFEAWRELCGPVEAVSERRRHPKFDGADLCTVTVGPGDVLYTPPFWWHHVETACDSPAVSVLVPFDQSIDEANTLGEGSSHYLIHYH